jgi:NADPH:quinone reductase-like Zn-dependent oxidoreductase
VSTADQIVTEITARDQRIVVSEPDVDGLRERAAEKVPDNVNADALPVGEPTRKAVVPDPTCDRKTGQRNRRSHMANLNEGHDAAPAMSTVPSSTMAVRVFEHGDPGKLIYGEYALDEPGPRDVVVKVRATSVSGWDIKYRAGLSFSLPGRVMFPLPQQLGREAAGEVVAVGSEVQELSVGQRVVGVVHPENFASREAARGLGNLSTGIALPGHQALGSYAQYLMRDESMWLALPDDTDFEQAAVTLWPFATSHRAVTERLQVRLGDAVIIAGISGGMGLATAQLAHLAGARVFGVTRSSTKASALRALDAVDDVVVYEDPSEAQRQLRELTGGYGAEHAIDYSGDPGMLPTLVGALALGGKLALTSGEQHPDTLPIMIRDFMRLELSVLGVRGARASDTRVIRGLLATGRINMPIAARFALSQAAAAHEWFERERDQIGRVILDPWAEAGSEGEHPR